MYNKFDITKLKQSRHDVNKTLLGPQVIGASEDQYPAENFFPSTIEDVGFTNAAVDDYALAVGSTYAGAGSDGRDLGADIAAIRAVTAAVTP